MLVLLLLALVELVSAGVPPPSHLAQLEVLSAPYATKRAEDELLAPLVASSSSSALAKRADSGSSNLGDYFDLSYTVMVKVGEVEMPLIIDTVSGDLYVLADDCTECNSTGLAVYPKSSFVPTPYSVESGQTPSLTTGPIGIETVELAGISISDQYFSALNFTNSMIGISSSGVLGLGFPVSSGGTRFRGSSVWWAAYVQSYDAAGGNKRTRSSTYSTFGPLLARMAMAKTIMFPMFSLSFQRVSIDLTTTNPGIFSLGDLPSGVQNESLQWTQIRRYTDFEANGLDRQPEDERPFKEWPVYWEIFIEDVYFDGVKLPWTESANYVNYSASIESTSSWIQGPPEVIQQIRETLHGDWFDCSIPHTLTFQIGGMMFPVDPRDFILPLEANSTKICRNILLSADGIPATVEDGPRYSWILGTPFLKGVFAAFYYGNITYPWLDPPRVGLLSRVPGNAGELLKEAVKKGIFPNTTEELFASSSSTSSSAVRTSTPTSPVRTGDALRSSCWWAWWWGILLLLPFVKTFLGV